jgi:hypothetical protein
VGHQTTAEVDEVTACAGFTVLTYFKIYTLQIIIFIATVVALPERGSSYRRKKRIIL